MDSFQILTLVLILLFVSAVLARVHEVGPIIWFKRAARRERAQEGTDRWELVARVQQLLPQANDGNVMFSLHRESSASGGCLLDDAVIVSCLISVKNIS